MSVRSSSDRNNRRPRVGRKSGPSPTNTESPTEDEFSGVNDDFLKPQIGANLSPEDLERSVLTPVIAEENDLSHSATKQKLNFQDASLVSAGDAGGENSSYLKPSIGRDDLPLQRMQTTLTRKPKTSVDGGWSWLVLAASTLVGFISLGMLFSFGAYFIYFEDYFKGASKGNISVLYGLFGLQFFIAPLATTLADDPRIGYRLTVVIGGLVAAIGYGTSFFATRLWHLYLTLGIVASTGSGLVYAPSVGIVGHYFDRHKYFASTLVTVGSALGVFVFPPLFTLTADFYGWRGSMLINCGIATNICVCGMVYAADPHRTPHSASPVKTVGSAGRTGDVEQSGAITTAHTVAHSTTSSSVVRVDTFHLYLFRDPLFISMLIYTFFASSYTNFLYFIPLMYEQHFHAADHKQSAALLLSLFGVGNAVARILNATLNVNEAFAKKFWNRFRVAEASAGLLAFAHIYVFYAGSALELQLFSVLIGACWGFVLSSWPGMLTELFGRRVLSITWGRALLFCGLYRFILVPISGWLIDATASFAAAFYIAGVCQLIACGLLLYVDVKQTNRMKRVSYKTADEMVPDNVPRNRYDEANTSALSPELDRHQHQRDGGVDGENIERRTTQNVPPHANGSGRSPSGESKKRVEIVTTSTTTTTTVPQPTPHVPSPPPLRDTFNADDTNNGGGVTAEDADEDDDPTLKPTIDVDANEDADIVRPMPVDGENGVDGRHDSANAERIAPT